MLYLNQATFAGNIGSITRGEKHAFISLAINNTYKDKGGNKQPRTDWLEIKVFRKNLVAFVKEYLETGSHIYVEAHVQKNEYEKDGEKRYELQLVANQIQFVQPKSE